MKLEKIDLKDGGDVRKLRLVGKPDTTGDQSAIFETSKAFKFLAPLLQILHWKRPSCQSSWISPRIFEHDVESHVRNSTTLATRSLKMAIVRLLRLTITMNNPFSCDVELIAIQH